MARLLLNATERHWRDHFDIRKWAETNVIRETYFHLIDLALEEFSRDGIDAPDRAVLAMIAIGLTEDDSLVSHCLRKGDIDVDFGLLEDVAAKVLYEAYMRAVEGDTWQRT
jgi:hypothetical protein